MKKMCYTYGMVNRNMLFISGQTAAILSMFLFTTGLLKRWRLFVLKDNK